MSKTQEIWYEPHPVTPERKAELRAAGYCIIDARFKPDDASQEIEGDGSGEALPSVSQKLRDAPAKRGRKPGKPDDANEGE